jgi:hypothetical protein
MNLSPSILANNLFTLSLLFSAVTMVLWSTFFDKKIVFPISDFVKKNLRSMFKNRTVLIGKMCDLAGKVSATTIFLSYCFFGTTLFATYIVHPVLGRVQDYILVVVILSFLFVHNVVNHNRRRYFS